MSHPQKHGFYHYHFAGTCMRKDLGHWSNTKAPGLCKDRDGCEDDPLNYVLTQKRPNNAAVAYSAETWDEPIGLAKDGHIILALHDSNGDMWSCDNHDVCNGTFVGDDKDVYAYVATETFPYIVGCWGPGPQPQFAPTCS